jgi:hypothetical protein
MGYSYSGVDKNIVKRLRQFQITPNHKHKGNSVIGALAAPIQKSFDGWLSSGYS